MSDPREVALELLRVVRDDEAYANLAMAVLLRESKLSGRDAAFATELGYGTLRWQAWYDAILATCITRESVEPAIRDVLRLGVHQILAMRVPDHAAVDSSCTLARAAGAPGGAQARAGFVNAVLRRVAERDTNGWAEHLSADRNPDDPAWLATRWSHPAWIVRALRDALGDRRNELTALLQADNVAARPSLVARPGRMSIDELLTEPGVEPGVLSPLAGTLVEGIPDALASVRDGRAGVQDEGSQLVALALTRAAGGDARWLDVCSGPGGKAAILAGVVHERGGSLTCVEPHGHRARLVEHAVAGLADVVVGDARLAPWGDELFDRVLVDAPCTGIGALRRRPESRWRRTAADLAALGPLQRDLLRTALDATKPGGVVAYVTCSPHLSETEFVVRDVMRGRDGVTLEDARSLVPEVADCGEGPFVQLWPHRHGTDAMFLAILRQST